MAGIRSLAPLDLHGFAYAATAIAASMFVLLSGCFFVFLLANPTFI